MTNRIRNLVTGICLIIIAAGLILWKLGKIALHFTIAGVGGFWLIVAIALAAYVIAAIIDLNFSSIFFPLAIIAIIFRAPLGITALSPWIILIVAGLLTAAYEKIFPDPVKKELSHEYGNVNESEIGGKTLYHSISFGESTKYIRSDCLEKAGFKVTCGEINIYFDQVSVPSGEVSINTKTIFGETVLFIPKEWEIDNRVSVIGGDTSYGGAAPETCGVSVRCIITGKVRGGELRIERV